MKDKKNAVLIVSILLVVLVLIGLGITVMLKKDKNKEEEEVKVAFEVPYDYDSKEIIKYNFGGTYYYIYLLNDDTLKVAEGSEVYETQPDCNCLEPTGKFEYKELDYTYTEEEMVKIRTFFEGVFKDVDDDRVELFGDKLDSVSTRMILAIILDEDGVITFEDDLKFVSSDIELVTNYKGRVGAIKQTYIDKSTNPLVTNISKYLNDFYSKDVKDIKALVDKTYNRISHTNYSANYIVNLKGEYVYLGSYYTSFTYNENGNIGNNWYNKMYGFTFNFNGEPIKFPNGYKDKYLEQIMTQFNASKTFTKYKSELDKKYADNIKKSIFNTGNWYMKDDSIVFIVSSDMLGINDITFGYELVEVKKMFDTEF